MERVNKGECLEEKISSVVDACEVYDKRSETWFSISESYHPRNMHLRCVGISNIVE